MKSITREKTADCNLLTLKEAISTFNLCETMIEKLAKQCGAKLKIGRSARYKRDVLEQYLDTFVVE